MNHRERFFTALDLKEPDCVPITDLGLDPPIVRALMGEALQSSSFGKEVFSMSGGSESWQSSVDYRLALVQACKKLDFDAVPVLSASSLTTKRYKPRITDQNRFVDQWGRIMQTSPKAKTTFFVGGTVNTPEDLENYDPPDAFDSDVVEMMDVLMKPLRSEDIVTMAILFSGWHLAFQVRGGIDKIGIDFYRNPSFARKLLDKLGRACQGIAQAAIEAGVDVLFVADDYADNHGPLISPKFFREFELPNLKRIVEIGKKRGVAVLKHSDGNLYPILDDIIDTGIDGLHPIEPGAMDLADIKAKYGKTICLFGNVDCRYVLSFGREEDVRKDVRRCIDAAARGGGFVLTSSNSLHANVKVENIHAMVEEARKYGKYPLASSEQDT